MKKHWSKEGFVYQIYPRSFKDSNQDGIGDLGGIIEKVPYLKSLGVSMLWLSPIYQSPNDDNGYDISDYRQIHPDFGTLEQFKELVEKLHQAKIRLIMDLVVNHTSDEHEWFEKSVQRIEPYTNYYHWKDEMTNWGSFFGGKAWTYHPIRQQYYLHLFSQKQPDLNWENPLVREEVKAICRYWLDLGVDGFRCDVINLIAKKEGCPNGKKSLILTGKEHYLNESKIHSYLQELRDDVFRHYDCFTVGETVFITPEIALSYIHEDIRELDMVFQFEHMSTDCFGVKWFPRKFSMKRMRNVLNKWQIKLQPHGWNSLYLENHDQARSINRFGSLQWREESAKMLATMIYFQQGTPYLYQGQEIGMTNADFQTLEEYQDIETKNIYQTGRKLLRLTHKQMMKRIQIASRDNARTPMQWDDGPNAGFSKTLPWLGVNQNHQTINVAASIKDQSSIWHYMKRIITLRKEYPTIVYGSSRLLCPRNSNFYIYQREDEAAIITIACSFSKKPKKLPKGVTFMGDCLLHNYPTILNERSFQPFEARVYIHKKEKERAH